MTRHDDLYVVIPTKNRHQVLARALQTLALQTVLPAELIVVDQSAVKKDLGELPFPVRHIYDPAISGSSQARNRALELIAGGLVLFLDDDIEMEPDFIAEILAAFAENPEAAAISGVITNYPPPPPWRRAFDRIFRLGPFFDERQPIYWNCDRLRNHPAFRVRKLSGGLMCVARSRIGKVRFDETLTGASLAEDAEFCYSLGDSTLLLITPRARLQHLKTPSAREHFHWAEREMRSSHYYFGRYGKGLGMWLVFAWFNLGMLLLTAGSSLRRLSLRPLREFFAGAKAGRELGARMGRHHVAGDTVLPASRER